MNREGNPDLGELLADIVFWGERLRLHLKAVEEAEFLENDIVCDAACWCISCIGEAAGKIRQMSPDLVPSEADLELARSYAMRNRLVHGYFALDPRIIWNAATVSVPSLVSAARAMTKE